VVGSTGSLTLGLGELSGLALRLPAAFGKPFSRDGAGVFSVIFPGGI
jgi:hypothetical protein